MPSNPVRRTRSLVAAALAVLQGFAPVAADAAGGGSIGSREGLLPAPGAEAELRQQGLILDEPAAPLEAPIDPAAYRIVPGDVLHLGLWGEAVRGYLLTVTPQGELIVPNIGPVFLAGETLDAAEARVRGLLLPQFPAAPATLRLIRPGRFLVPVTGMVGQPGIFETSRLGRLSSLLGQAGGVRSGGSLRRIRLVGSGDHGTEVDLLPWLVAGDPAANPSLGPGDRIEVPGRGPTIRVRGPVNGRTGLDEVGSPGGAVRADAEPSWVLEWREGDSVGSALELVGGLSEFASGDGILRRDGRETRIELRDDPALSTPLRPGDEIEATYAPRWVFVVGAVRAPGRYPYLPGLAPRDYVHMAGGPTELGRGSGWSIEPEEGGSFRPGAVAIAPGATIKVPERRSYKLTTVLAPVTSATALIISIVALARRGN